MPANGQCNCNAICGQPHFHDCPAKISADLLSGFLAAEQLSNQEGKMPEKLTEVCAEEAIAIIQECRQMLKLSKGQKLTDAIRAITQSEGSAAVFNAMAKFWEETGCRRAREEMVLIKRNPQATAEEDNCDTNGKRGVGGMNEQERTWLDNASRRGGSFVSTFANACYCADDENFKLLKPVLAQMIEKYPNYSVQRGG